MSNLLAALFVGHWQAWGVGEILISIVIIAACAALVGVALRKFQVAIPEWVVQCLWIVGIAFVVILCIRLVLSF